MDLTIPRDNVKCFAHMVHSVAKVATYMNLIVCNQRNTLKIQAVNPYHSAFIEFTLYTNFFNGFDVDTNMNGSYHVNVKQFLAIFRSVNTITHLKLFKRLYDAEYDSCLILIYPSKVLQRTFRLKVREEEPRTAEFDSTEYMYKFQWDSYNMITTLQNFSKSVSEISFAVEARSENENGLRMKISEYRGDQTVMIRNDLSTSVVITSSQFQRFESKRALSPDEERRKEEEHQPDNKNEYTSLAKSSFNLKDLVSFVQFATTANQSMVGTIGRPGEPVLFSSLSDPIKKDYEALLLLATANEDIDTRLEEKNETVHRNKTTEPMISCSNSDQRKTTNSRMDVADLQPPKKRMRIDQSAANSLNTSK